MPEREHELYEDSSSDFGRTIYTVWDADSYDALSLCD
jgi:hypothetical protein